MKREYVTPIAVCETFEANEYVAACSDPGTTTYNFTCDAKGKYDWRNNSDGGAVYQETNGKDGLQTGWGGDTKLGNYHACGITHSVTVPKGTPVTDIFKPGYLDPYSGSTFAVTVWRGEDGNNIHCCASMGVSDFVPAKS